MYTVILKDQDNTEIKSFTTDLTLEQAEDLAKSEAEDFLEQFKEITEIRWSVINEISDGIKKRS